LLFLDESGVTTNMTRHYGRAPRGERVQEGTPGGHWRTLTVLGALTLQGLRAPMTIESPTDGDVFLAYLEQVLCPQLQPGQVVIMDNLAAHKVAGVRSLIEARGAQLLYLPPYSPDFQSHRASLVKNQRAFALCQGPVARHTGSRHHPGSRRCHHR
jgi:DDE superfamily endonuclease